MGGCNGKQQPGQDDYDIDNKDLTTLRNQTDAPFAPVLHSQISLDRNSTTTKLLQKGIEAKFNHTGDDVKEISKGDLAKKDRYQKFEYMFPFYRMDVAGYQLKIKQAMAFECPEKIKSIWEVESISFDSLRKAFATHTGEGAKNGTWSDINEDHSELCKFLRDAMLHDGTDSLNVHKLQTLGILWCNGNEKSKATQAYLILQCTNQDRVNSHDKDFPPFFNQILDTASEMVFRFETKYMGTSKRLISEAIVQQKKMEYDDLMETFLDEIFGSDSMVTKKEWIDLVVKKQKWLFSGTTIREKLGYEIVAEE